MTTRRPPRPPSDRDAPRGGRAGRTPPGRGNSRADSRAEGRDAPRSDRNFNNRGDAPRGPRNPRGDEARREGPRSAIRRGPDARSEGPHSAGPRSTGPRSTGPRSTGPQGGGPRSTGPQGGGPRSENSRAERPAANRSVRGNGRAEQGRDSSRDNRRFDARPPRAERNAENSAKSAPRKAPARARTVRGAVHDSDQDVDSEGDRIGDPQRIAKLLARAGVGSRRDVERMIGEGRIALNGEVIIQPAPLLASLEGLTVDGNPVAKPVSTRLYRFYKPVGCLTAARDPKGRKTIYDVLPAGLPRLMPVGRLDYNTEGLMLLTNDGELKRKLELPASGVERTYRARAFGDISQAQLEELVLGVEIDGVRYGKIDANLERRTGRNQWIELTLTEGKNREVRNVLEHLGLQVSRLIRVSYGEFSIDGLEAGQVDVVPRDILFQFRRLLG